MNFFMKLYVNVFIKCFGNVDFLIHIHIDKFRSLVNPYSFLLSM